VGFPIICEAGR